MPIFHHQLQLKSHGSIELLDLTADIKAWLPTLPLANGLLLITSLHSTGAIRINEKCSALEKDFLMLVEKLIPAKATYHHNQVAVDGRPNAHSHLLAYLMSPTATLEVKDGQLLLGEWQSIFFLELDGPREKRRVNLTFYA